MVTVGNGFATGSCGDGADDFLLLPKLSWLRERGKRARKVGAVTVVVAVAVTFEEAVVIMAISEAVELCGKRMRRIDVWNTDMSRIGEGTGSRHNTTVRAISQHRVKS